MSQTLNVVPVLRKASELLQQNGWRPVGSSPKSPPPPGALSLLDAVNIAAEIVAVQENVQGVFHAREPGDIGCRALLLAEDTHRALGKTIRSALGQHLRGNDFNLIEHASARAPTALYVSTLLCEAIKST